MNWLAARRSCARRAKQPGDPPSDIEITVWPGSADPKRELDAAWIRRYLEAGATRIITRPHVTKPADLQRLSEQIRQFRSVLSEAAA